MELNLIEWMGRPWIWEVWGFLGRGGVGFLGEGVGARQVLLGGLSRQNTWGIPCSWGEGHGFYIHRWL